MKFICFSRCTATSHSLAVATLLLRKAECQGLPGLMLRTHLHLKEEQGLLPEEITGLFTAMEKLLLFRFISLSLGRFCHPSPSSSALSLTATLWFLVLKGKQLLVIPKKVNMGDNCMCLTIYLHLQKCSKKAERSVLEQ